MLKNGTRKIFLWYLNMKTSVNVPEKSDPEYDPATAL